MFKRPPSDAKLEAALDRVLLLMEGTEPGTSEYKELVNQLSDLHALKVNNTKTRVSNDTLATIAANIAGIILILNFERTQIVTTKAMAFVQKLR